MIVMEGKARQGSHRKFIINNTLRRTVFAMQQPAPLMQIGLAGLCLLL
jgi:hypothetical protein